MRKNYYILLLLLGIINSLIGQNANLISNYSFEDGVNSPGCVHYYSGLNEPRCRFDDDISFWRIAKYNPNCWCTGGPLGDCPSPDWIDVNTCASVDGAEIPINPASNRCVRIGGGSGENYKEGIRIGLVDDSGNPYKLSKNKTYTLRIKLAIRDNGLSKLRIHAAKYGEHWNAIGGGNVRQVDIAYFEMSGLNYQNRKFYSLETTLNPVDDDKDNVMENIIFTCEQGMLLIDDVELYEHGCDETMYIENKTYTFKEAPYEADPYIIAGYEVANPPYGSGNVIVTNNADVIYKADQEVDLEPGFEAEEGSEFLAFIAPCGRMCPYLPTIIAGVDINCCNSPYQLGMGSDNTLHYLWTAEPSSALAYLSSTIISNPVFTPPINSCGFVNYTLTVSNDCNESASDIVLIKYNTNINPSVPSIVASITSNQNDCKLALNIEITDCTEKVYIEIWTWGETSKLYSYELISGTDYNCCNFNWSMPDYITKCNNYKVKVYSESICISQMSNVVELDWMRNPVISIVFAPNVITPNGDGLNDQLCFIVDGAESYTIEIFSSDGPLVYTSGGPGCNKFCIWDGSCPWGMCEDNYYYYVATFDNACQDPVSISGWIWLVSHSTKYNISGNLHSSPLCGGDIVENDSLYIKQNGQNLDSISPAITQPDGSFSFNPDEVELLDTNLLYTINTKNGFSLSDTNAKTISQWSNESPLSLTLKNVNREWIARYSGTDTTRNWPVAIDLYGNIYVSAVSWSNQFFAPFMCLTIKYNPLGQEQWVRAFDAGNYGTNIPAAMAIDNTGNIYITGSSGTIKYDEDGNLLWSNTDERNMQAISVDENNNVFVTGFNSTVKYDSNGNKLWQNDSYTANGGWSEAVKTDDVGNVYLAGTAQYAIGFSTIRKFLTIKLDPDGNLLWQKTFSGFPPNQQGDTMNTAYAIALDNASVYVSGTGGVIKYNTDGILQWSLTGADGESHNHLAVDSSGNIYASGYPLQKISPAGNILWSNSDYGSKSNVAIDDQQNVYATGPATMKFDPDGNILWSEIFVDYVNINAGRGTAGLALSPNGNVYITGGADNHNVYPATSDVVTVKYSQCPDQAYNIRVQNSNTTENVQQAKEINVMVVPNPNNGTMQVYYTLKEQLPAFFEIYDLTGRKVFSQPLNVDSRSITISQQQLNGGVYMYMLVQNNVVIAIDKMVIIK